jgi:hypothetical protein
VEVDVRHRLVAGDAVALRDHEPVEVEDRLDVPRG